MNPGKALSASSDMPEPERLAAELAKILSARGLTCATAESCTGGLIGAAFTALPGSSLWYKGGVIAYANAVKTSLLDVPPDELAAYGAVSEPVVRSMALGACRRLGTDAALSVSGVAGPDGGTQEKPVGTVWLGWALDGPSGIRVAAERHHFSGDRESVRRAAVCRAISGLLVLLR